jgi:hypothetical protein
VESDDHQLSTLRQEIDTVIDETTESLEFLVDGDTQRLKGSRGRMNPPSPLRVQCLDDEISEFAGRFPEVNVLVVPRFVLLSFVNPVLLQSARSDRPTRVRSDD